MFLLESGSLWNPSLEASIFRTQINERPTLWLGSQNLVPEKLSHSPIFLIHSFVCCPVGDMLKIQLQEELWGGGQNLCFKCPCFCFISRVWDFSISLVLGQSCSPHSWNFGFWYNLTDRCTVHESDAGYVNNIYFTSHIILFIIG